MSNIYFDKEEFIRQTVDSEEIAIQVAKLYHRDLAHELESINLAFSNGNIEAVRKLSHKAKSGFIIMGAKSLYDVAIRIETRSKNGETDLAEDLKIFTEMCEALDKELIEEFKTDNS